MVGKLNDLWKYDLVDNAWYHVRGNKSVNKVSDYDLSYPGGVYRHAMVIDRVNRSLYMFGGQGFDGSSEGI